MHIFLSAYNWHSFFFFNTKMQIKVRNKPPGNEKGVKLSQLKAITELAAHANYINCAHKNVQRFALSVLWKLNLSLDDDLNATFAFNLTPAHKIQKVSFLLTRWQTH